MNFNKTLYIIFFFGFLLFTKSLSAQFASPQNLGSLRVDELNDDQIRSFIRQVEASGLTQMEL